MKIFTGKILSAHGIKGEVKVKPMTDNPHRFRRGNSLYIEKDDAFALITAVREANGGILIVKFKGIDDRNHAERLKSSFLQIEEEDAAPLPEGSYYLFQLQGMTVFEEDGNRLGIIAEIIQNGANDVYQIDCENGDMLLLPALKQVMKEVDVENKKMIVRLLPGLKEACTYHES